MKLLQALLFPLSLGALLTSSCAVRPDRDYPNQLAEKLRILAIGSEPAEIPFGQAGDISALVYLPPDVLCQGSDQATYEWSWCPARGGEEMAFECLFSEEETQLLWENSGGDGAIPAFDLGDGERAELSNQLGGFAELICSQEIDEEDAAAQLAYDNCLKALTPSVRLEVRYCGLEAIAVKSVSFLTEEQSSDPDFRPNQNPTMTGEMFFRSEFGGDELAAEEPIENGQTYHVNLELEEIECETDDASANCMAEVFTPDASSGQNATERRETLVMSWYMTKGHTAPEKLNGEEYAPDTGSQLGQQTFYVASEGEVEQMLGNLLDLTEESPGPGEVFVVLRDERGGIAWRRFPFTVEEN